MKLLKTINPQEIKEHETENWQHRDAVRAVVFDSDGCIGLLNVKKENYFKLPGGGIEPGETQLVALNRECKEELGIKIKVTGEVGEIMEYRTERKLYHTSYCYLAQIDSDKNVPQFTDEERLQEFMALWVSPREALGLLNLKLTTDYEGKFIEERDYCFLTNALNLLPK